MNEDSLLNSLNTIDNFTHEYVDNHYINPSDTITKYDFSMMNSDQVKVKKNLRCVVCGGRAYGYNFDQISCESCKAFFRRNALKDMVGAHCRFSGSCNITIESRRHCAYCRIKKCFAVGMKKESIRSEEEKYMKRLQLEKHRRHKNRQQPIIPPLMTIGNTNILTILRPEDRTRINNLIHCFDHFACKRCSSGCCSQSQTLYLRVHEFFNRKKRVFVNLVTYFKQLPELKALNLEDQVSLIKQNIRILIPLNYAILRTSNNSKRRTLSIQTIGLFNNINLHDMFRKLSNCFVDLVAYDPIIMKLLITILFFTSTSLTTRSIFDSAKYKELNTIRNIQSSYTELLWLYLIEKYGQKDAIIIFTKMITKYLYVQIIVDQVDVLVHMNDDKKNIDSLMQSFLQLT